MKITLNNRLETLPKEGITINELLELKQFTFKMLVIKVNGTLIKKHEYSLQKIYEGDDVTVLHLVSGG